MQGLMKAKDTVETRRKTLGTHYHKVGKFRIQFCGALKVNVIREPKYYLILTRLS